MNQIKLYHLVAAVGVIALAILFVGFRHPYGASQTAVQVSKRQRRQQPLQGAPAINMLEPITVEDRKAADALVKKISQEKPWCRTCSVAPAVFWA
jgi:hypothetical protein